MKINTLNDEITPECDRAMNLIRKGNIEAGLAVIEREIKNNPNAWASYTYATALYTLHQHKGGAKIDVLDEVIANYERTIELNPTIPDAHLMLGVVYRRMAVEKSREFFQKPDSEKNDQIRGYFAESINRIKMARNLSKDRIDFNALAVKELDKTMAADHQYVALSSPTQTKNSLN